MSQRLIAELHQVSVMGTWALSIPMASWTGGSSYSEFRIVRIEGLVTPLGSQIVTSPMPFQRWITGFACKVKTGKIQLAVRDFPGIVILPRVTKKLDILVVADPSSASSKAKKAREYGTRVLAEMAFWRAIGVRVD